MVSIARRSIPTNQALSNTWFEIVADRDSQISTSQTWTTAIFLVSLLDNVITLLFDGSAVIALLKTIRSKP